MMKEIKIFAVDGCKYVIRSQESPYQNSELYVVYFFGLVHSGHELGRIFCNHTTRSDTYLYRSYLWGNSEEKNKIFSEGIIEAENLGGDKNRTLELKLEHFLSNHPQNFKTGDCYGVL